LRVERADSAVRRYSSGAVTAPAKAAMHQSRRKLLTRHPLGGEQERRREVYFDTFVRLQKSLRAAAFVSN